MSVAECYTDFHIDMGGTSVWYHILHGKKVRRSHFVGKRNMRSFRFHTLENLKDYVKYQLRFNFRNSEYCIHTLYIVQCIYIYK